MDVGGWLRGLGLGQYEATFRENAIDETVLPSLTAEDVRDLGVAMVGHRRKLLDAIALLRADRNVEASRAATAPASERPHSDIAERRQVTVMFCDLVGSTALSARLDPEDMREIIAAYHRCCSAQITKSGGFVAKYMGDGVLAYFGYPEAHEDDAERSVRAGLAIVDAVHRLSLPQRLRVRLGIATGLVIVGDLIGSGAAQEQAVVGETPNLAARLQALAEPDSIVIADATRRQVGSLFEVRDLGPQSLKGFAETMRAWQVFGESAVASRFEALRSRAIPLIGRDEEIALLLRRWDHAKAGEGRVVLLSAEPGIGKSRLTEGLAERIAADPHWCLRYFCTPHHQESALHPIIGHLERAAGFSREDDATGKRGKLATLLASGASDASDRALLADLLSLPPEKGQVALDITPQRKKEKTFDALLRRLESLARERPILMVFEDLHWMDPTSLELLDHMVARVERLPVLMVATHRPEFQPPWVGQAHVTMLALSRLGRREGAALVERLAGNAATLPAELVDEILERTDGVPLFLEEVTKVVLEAGSGMRDVAGAIPAARSAVPATLQASLLARLDRLGSIARDIAQTGAAIGREFPYDLLTVAASRGEDEVRGALDRLVSAGLVFQRGMPPAAEYQFKHALVQDTAYGTLLRAPRQSLHGRIAAAIEQCMPDRVEREPELLAYHLGEAGQTARAALYWRKAGEKAVRRAANREGIEHFRRALALVETQPDGPERRQAEFVILSQLSAPLLTVKGWSSAEGGEVVERAALLGRQLESSRDLGPAIANLWIFNAARGRIDRAEEISADLFRMSRELGDDEMMLQAHHCAWATQFFRGRFKDSLHHIESGAALYDLERHAHHRHLYLGHDPGTCGMNFGASVQHVLGYPGRSMKLIRDGFALCGRIEHAPSRGNTLWRACEVYAMRREISEVLRTAVSLIEFCDTHGLPIPRAHAAAYLGWARVRSGDVTAGMKLLIEAQEVLATLDARVHATVTPSLHADALLTVGRYEEGLAKLATGLELSATSGELSYAAWLYRIRAALLLHARGAKDPEVEASLRQAIDLARRQDAKGWEIGATVDLARLWVEQGRRAEAHELLAPIYGWFTEGFDMLDLKEAKGLLDSLK